MKEQSKAPAINAVVRSADDWMKIHDDLWKNNGSRGYSSGNLLKDFIDEVVKYSTQSAEVNAVVREDSYWEQRCKAAEKVMLCKDPPKNKASKDNNQFQLFREAYGEWQNLCSQPTSPIDKQEQREVDQSGLTELRNILIQHLLDGHEPDKPYMVSGRKSYTKRELAEEIKNNTHLGKSTVENCLSLAMDMLSRGKATPPANPSGVRSKDDAARKYEESTTDDNNKPRWENRESDFIAGADWQLSQFKSKPDAVEFAEWLRDNYRKHGDLWAHKDWSADDYVNNKLLTTSELYQLFKKR